jgi:hypothetical protein
MIKSSTTTPSKIESVRDNGFIGPKYNKNRNWIKYTKEFYRNYRIAGDIRSIAASGQNQRKSGKKRCADFPLAGN